MNFSDRQAPARTAAASAQTADLTVVGGAGHVGIPLVLSFAAKGLTVNVNDINRAFALGWIKSKDVKNVLVTGVTQASKLKKQGDRIVAYKLILEALKLAKNLGVVSLQGYQIISSDINWLINH